MSAVELRERRLKQLDERLQLTEEQKVKIRAIWDASEAQVRAIQASSGDKQQRLRDLAAQTREHIRVILTPVQQKGVRHTAHRSAAAAARAFAEEEVIAQTREGREQGALSEANPFGVSLPAHAAKRALDVRLAFG
ncbi:MAG: hypothetical protein NVV63_03780 [Opitutus sp.]|nr:hypothetical protein [Opitutus sp.]